MNRYIIALGGGELKTKTTNAIDAKIAALAKERAGERRAVALFVPTASHDSLPYFNTFRKTYTSDFGLKADVALLTKKDIPMEKIRGKIENADLIYVGGGNTVYMLEVWKKTGFDALLLEAYRRGVILAGVSAGGICWFEQMFSDADRMDGTSNEFKMYAGLGVLKGTVAPHFEERKEEFSAALQTDGGEEAYGIETNAALVFANETLRGKWSAGGDAYAIQKKENGVFCTPVPFLE